MEEHHRIGLCQLARLGRELVFALALPNVAKVFAVIRSEWALDGLDGSWEEKSI